MRDKLKNILTIGAVHLPPLPGYAGFPGLNIATKNALADAIAFQRAGFDAVIIENNYDIPHKEFTDPATISAMTVIAQHVKASLKIKLGISVLWNDYKSALSIAKIVRADFVRIPVFVDTVKTAYGVIKGNPSEVLKYKRSIGAENILIFSDIHVKHAKLFSHHNLIESARRAVKFKSSALIVTGRWTGDAPILKELEMVRKAFPSTAIIVGSGADVMNISRLLHYANGVIVSTSLKKDGGAFHKHNIKSYQQRIDINKAKAFIKSIKAK
ncbi:MAG: BtpA/SgcQ family protein [Patescibacteria group bacterium]|mgnify:CR=1 FL=1